MARRMMEVQQDGPTWYVRQCTGKHTVSMRRTARARGCEGGARARRTLRTRWREKRSGGRAATQRHIHGLTEQCAASRRARAVLRAVAVEFHGTRPGTCGAGRTGERRDTNAYRREEERGERTERTCPACPDRGQRSRSQWLLRVLSGFKGIWSSRDTCVPAVAVWDG
eukprot:3297989-Prymnesium_polylepis.1